MKENWMEIIGITNKNELHIHGNCNGQEFYTNIEISKILDILSEYTESIGDKIITEMLEHLAMYFYDKI